jgi:hypothetical protein
MHSLVYVIIPSTTTDIFATVEYLLAGSEQNPTKEYKKFTVPCVCINSIAQRETYQPFDKSEEGQELSAILQDARRKKDRATEEVILVKRFRIIHTLERRHPMYMKPDPECEYCQGTGKDTDDYDPNGEWDYWEIGGRWNHLFIDTTTITDPKSQELIGNIAYVRDVLTKGTPAAIVTPEGEWHTGPIVLLDELFEPERTEEELQGRVEWKEKAQQMLQKYVNEMIVVVDCHS